jgi:hypothetical protein
VPRILHGLEKIGARIGYAVTCVYGLPDPNFSGRLNFMDVIDATRCRAEANDPW